MRLILNAEERDMIQKIVATDKEQANWDFSIGLLQALLNEMPLEDADTLDYNTELRAVLSAAIARIPEAAA